MSKSFISIQARKETKKRQLMLSRTCARIQYNAAPQLTLEINPLPNLTLPHFEHDLDCCKQDSCCGQKEGNS